VLKGNAFIRLFFFWGFIPTVFLFPAAYFSFSDTIVLKGAEELKGVVVEEYKDRIVLSTEGGEKELLRGNIADIIFDLEEQNLASLGDFYQDRGMYRKAYYYYSKALEINPEYKKAIDGINYVGTYIHQTSRMKKLSHIQKLNEQAEWEKGSVDKGFQSSEEKIVKSLGIVLKNSAESFEISRVVSGSPAAEAGVKKGDVLLAVWGRAITYMETGEVLDKLANHGTMDVHITFSRFMMVKMSGTPAAYGNPLGVKLGFSEMEGLMVEEVREGSAANLAGIKSGDMLTEVQGQSTRYMPLNEVIRTIDSREGSTVFLKIRRDAVLWKKLD